MRIRPICAPRVRARRMRWVLRLIGVLRNTGPEDPSRFFFGDQTTSSKCKDSRSDCRGRDRGDRSPFYFYLVLNRNEEQES